MVDIESELLVLPSEQTSLLPTGASHNCKQASNEQALALTPVSKQILASADELGSRKKTKKRDRSPNSHNEASAVQPVAQSSNPQLNTQTSVGPSTSAANPKKEKQRPETWNKIEQQIFFNALRQVIFTRFHFLHEFISHIECFIFLIKEREKLRIDHSIFQRPSETIQNRRWCMHTKKQRTNSSLLLPHLAQNS
jgi:hypothetical protein